jgi:hypothetical protein
VRHSFVFLLDKFSHDPSFILGLRVVHLADQLPNFTSETLALDGLKPLVKALADALVGQVLNLETKVSLDAVFCLNFLDRMHKYGHPFVLRVCFLNI